MLINISVESFDSGREGAFKESIHIWESRVGVRSVLFIEIECVTVGVSAYGKGRHNIVHQDFNDNGRDGSLNEFVLLCGVSGLRDDYSGRDRGPNLMEDMSNDHIEVQDGVSDLRRKVLCVDNGWERRRLGLAVLVTGWHARQGHAAARAVGVLGNLSEVQGWCRTEFGSLGHGEEG